MKVLGVDFTSSPGKRKPITCAWGEVTGDCVLVLHELVTCESFESFALQLGVSGPWVGAFDFPFGLPRELVEHLGWPSTGKYAWRDLIGHYAAMPRPQIRETFKAFCDARPAGNKFAHRECDKPAGSSPSMKWVNPPVAYMLHAGAPLLRAAGVTIPGMQRGDSRVALEGYPGFLARSIVGNASYKSDAVAKHTVERAQRRISIVAALAAGTHPLSVQLKCARGLKKRLVEDASGDLLDAVLCCMQAAWGAQRPRYGLPANIDPIEGWIVSVPHD